jgi:hypothetical protein
MHTLRVFDCLRLCARALYIERRRNKSVIEYECKLVGVKFYLLSVPIGSLTLKEPTSEVTAAYSRFKNEIEF